MGRVGSFEEATNKISAWESQHNSHDNILGEHSDSPLPTKMAKSINESVHLNGAPRLKMPPPTPCGSPIQQSKELTTTSACPAKLSETSIADVVRPILAPRKVNQPKLPKRRMPMYGIWREFVPSENVWDDKDLSSSPEKGTTMEMFGLPLPTQKAREIGVRIGLAPDRINDQIHSHTKSRVKSKKRIKSSINFTFPSRKRKASSGVISNRGREKLPKHDAIPDLFASEDEDHEKFIHDHFTPEVLEESRRRCSKCRQLQCSCGKRKRSSASHRAANKATRPTFSLFTIFEW